MKELVKSIAKRILPTPIISKLAQWRGAEYSLPVVKVEFGNLHRLKPISEAWGFDRGLPIDRYYIENFLASHCDDINGRVLKIGDSFYTNKFGGDRVTSGASPCQSLQQITVFDYQE